MSNKVLEKKWIAYGLKCAIVFVDQSHRCGYVALPKGHIAYGLNYIDIDVDVHGGLTFNAYSKPNDIFNDDDDDLYWLGFDCAHAGDRILRRGIPSILTAHFWTLEEVIKETESLAKQLGELTIDKLFDAYIRNFLKRYSDDVLLNIIKLIRTQQVVDEL